MHIPESWTAEPVQLAVGQAGKSGLLRLRAAPIGGRTRLEDLFCCAPVQVQRAHYLDPQLPDLAFVTIASPSGGVLQGDRLRFDVDVQPGARLHLNTQSMTRVYRMPENHAEIVTELSVGSGSYLEYVPDPILPYPGARLLSQTTCIVAVDGVAVLGEVIAPGPAGLIDDFGYEAIHSSLEVRRPDGQLLFRDVNRLQPASNIRRPGKLGRYGALGSLYIVALGFGPDHLRQTLDCCGPGVYAGASVLPGAAGAWLKALAPNAERAYATITAAWDKARMQLVGACLPQARRY